MFLPTTLKEVRQFGWDKLDIILVSGDSYIDSPMIGLALIGKVLLKAGFRVGVIAQPEVSSSTDITRLGEPDLFWGISSGSVDSMVANRTASGRKRMRDDYTPGGLNNRRPDRAVIIYTNLIKKYFKNTRPIVLGGIEASLRRIAHFDFWTNKIKRSILFDAKADYLLYGMAERSIVELGRALKENKDPQKIPGLCYISKTVPEGTIILPSHKEVSTDKNQFINMFNTFYNRNNPDSGKKLAQKHDTRYLVQNPPGPYLKGPDLDAIYDLDFERDLHPFYRKLGSVKALETIRFSITTHRGCFGQCSFCAIGLMQGRQVRVRSIESIVREAKKIAGHPKFKGIIQDLGGPSANMYGFSCGKANEKSCAPSKKCLWPKVCSKLNTDHKRHIELLIALRGIKNIKKIFIASGIRYDLVLDDKKNGRRFLREVIKYHTSGQLKIAPEHSEKHVLDKMKKPGPGLLLEFKDLFYQITGKEDKKQFLTYYLMAAHPGCTAKDMSKLKSFCLQNLKILPEQVQIFTPTPSSYSTLMYCTGIDPFTGEDIFVEKTEKGRIAQKEAFLSRKTKNPLNRKRKAAK